jgi:hypothetical protein
MIWKYLKAVLNRLKASRLILEHGVSESIWAHLEALGTNLIQQISQESYGILWDHLGESGIRLRHLVSSGCILDVIGAPEGIWEHRGSPGLESSEGIWSNLG